MTMTRPDIVFTNAHDISADHHEQIAIRPCPAVDRLYTAAYPRRHTYEVASTDSVFETNEKDVAASIQRLEPRSFRLLHAGCDPGGTREAQAGLTAVRPWLLPHRCGTGAGR